MADWHDCSLPNEVPPATTQSPTLEFRSRWLAISVYMLAAILRTELGLELRVSQFLPILSVTCLNQRLWQNWSLRPHPEGSHNNSFFKVL
jgi:hypothetical protein